MDESEASRWRNLKDTSGMPMAQVQEFVAVAAAPVPAMTDETKPTTGPCTHDASDREVVAVADGMCPICLAARVAALEAGLRNLIGFLEIAAVMPDAIGKQLIAQWDGPELTAARALLEPTP